MSNVDTDERAGKRNALDEFAASTQQVVAAPSVQPLASPGDRVFGAQQVAVYRDEARILQKLAALGAAAGDDWFYRFPVRNKNGQKDFIEGASIKLANDVARIYGNCEVDTRVIDLGPSWLIYARFTDFESGYALTRPFQQNKNASKMGGSDNDRRLDIAFQIGVSKAIRNVVVNALQTFSDFAFEAARNSLIDKIGKDVKRWQEKTLQGLANHNVDPQRVEFVIGRAAKDWTAPDLAKIIAMMKAIGDGMTTVDETFPPKEKQVGGDVDAETGEVSEHSNSTALVETESSTGAAGAGPSDPNQGPDAGGPAESRAASTQPSASTGPAASGQAASESETSPRKKGTEAAKAPAADKTGAVPTNEAEYIAATSAWIETLDDADEGEKRWKAEKSLRNKANVGSDAREDLQHRLSQKCAEIRDADRS